MRTWSVRLIVVVILAGLGFWGSRVWFPGPEEVIRKRLSELARTASFSGSEGTLVKLAGAQALAAFCTPDVEITVDIPGHFRQTFSGQDELVQAAVGARRAAGGLNVQFFDIIVTVAPDQNSAVADLTAEGRVRGEKDFYVQELKFMLRKVDGKWLIFRVETVKTLSLGRPDVLPATDYGVRQGFARTYGWKELPSPRELFEYGERWRPHRSTAAWYFWRALELPDGF